MLRLLRTPCWSAPDATQDLPATVPGWAIAFLALQRDWITRERMAGLFWPDASADEALNNLRANLHRARRILESWCMGAALQAERRRVRLDLPCDVAALDEALAGYRWRDALHWYARPLLDGMGFPGFPALQAWADLERAERHGRWRAQMLRQARQETMAHDDALQIAERLLALDDLDEDAMQLQLLALRRAGRDQEGRLAAARHARHLRDMLGAGPGPSLQATMADLGAQDAPTAMPPEAPARGLFIGRALELGDIASSLARPDPHLLTLLGPGGIGKSRLAQQVMRRVEGSFPDGMHWIDLQDLTSADAVADRLAHALGAASARDDACVPAIATRVAGRRVLVALDNAEVVGDLHSLVERLRHEAPSLSVLVTSRARLGVQGEIVRTVEGLPVPDVDSRDAEAASAFDAVRLFEAAARAVQPAFRLHDDIDAVVTIVERLGGMPLAIELAASWVRLLPVREIARNLDDAQVAIDEQDRRATRPARPDHVSLQAVLERTWSMLSPVERTLMQALSTFDGGFTLVGARAVAGATLPQLSTLVDRCLLAVDDSGRFAVHPVTLAHARAHLLADAEVAAAVQRRHAEHFADTMAQMVAQHAGSPSTLLPAVEAEWANLALAWRWAALHARQDLLWRAAGAWLAYFKASARHALAIRHFEMSTRAEGDLLVRSRLQMKHAEFLVHARQPEAAAALALDALARAERAGDAELERECVSILGSCYVALGRWQDGARCLERALAMARARGDTRDVAINLSNLALATTFLGQFDAALERFDQAIATHLELGNTQSVARAMCNRGFVYVAAARWREAELPLQEAVRYASDHSVRGVAREAEFLLATVLVELGRLDDAERQLFRLRQAFEAEGHTGFAHKADYYLDRIVGLRGDSAGCVVRLLARYRQALDKGWPFDQLYIAIFVAEQLAALDRAELAGRVVAMVRRSPHAGAFNLNLMCALHLEAAPGVDSERVAEALASSADLDQLTLRLGAADARGR